MTSFGLRDSSATASASNRNVRTLSIGCGGIGGPIGGDVVRDELHRWPPAPRQVAANVDGKSAFVVDQRDELRLESIGVGEQPPETDDERPAR